MKEEDIQKIKETMNKVIEDYGCVLKAMRWDDEGFIEECAKTGHKLYHTPNNEFYVI